VGLGKILFKGGLLVRILQDADDTWDSTSASFVFDQVNSADNYIFYNYLDGAGSTLAETNGVANYFKDIQQVNTTFDDSEDWAQAYDSDSYMVTHVGTHEFGHWLQLGHSSVSGATMEQGTYKGDISWETLEQDDIDGINAIY